MEYLLYVLGGSVLVSCGFLIAAMLSAGKFTDLHMENDNLRMRLRELERRRKMEGEMSCGDYS